MNFKMYDCVFVLTVNGVNYQFVHVNSVGVEPSERKRLSRGANAGNKTGFVYREGVREADVVTVTLPDVSAALYNVLVEAYNDEERVDFSAVSQRDGSSKAAKDAIISQKPQQLTMDESPESADVALILESFDVDEVRKS
jgi:hypothetical protein